MYKLARYAVIFNFFLFDQSIFSMKEDAKNLPITNLIVKVPKGLGNDELFNINSLDSLKVIPFWNRIPISFYRSMNNYFSLNKKYFLARVVSESSAGFCVNYYTAQVLNALLFGLPIRDNNRNSLAIYDQTKLEKEKKLELHQDPITNLPIYSIEYFYLNAFEDKEFKYFCNRNDLLTNGTKQEQDKWIDAFYENLLDCNLLLKVVDQRMEQKKDFDALKYYDLAIQSLRGDVINEKEFNNSLNISKAKKLLLTLADQNKDLSIKALAQFYIIDLDLRYSQNMAPNVLDNLLESVKNQDNNLFAKFEAQFLDARLCIRKNDFINARKILTFLINQKINLFVKAKSELELGFICYCSKDFAESQKLLMLASKQEFYMPSQILSMIYLGHINFMGNGFAINFPKAKEYYEMAIENNNILVFTGYNKYLISALSNLAHIYNRFEKDYNKAKELYERAISLNIKCDASDEAFLSLAQMYIYGRGTAVDFKKAKSLLANIDGLDIKKEACAFLAQINLGEEQDLDSFKNLNNIALGSKKATALILSLFNSAHSYLFGLGNKQCFDTAEEIYKNLARTMLDADIKTNAQLCLAQMYLNGNEKKKNLLEAEKLLNEIVSNNNVSIFTKSQASVLLADYLKTKKELKNAYELYLKAEQQDINLWAQGYAQLKLAEMHYYQCGVEFNGAAISKYLNLALANPLLTDYLKSEAKKLLENLVKQGS